MSLELAVLGEVVLDTWGTNMFSHLGGRVLSSIYKGPKHNSVFALFLSWTLSNLTAAVLLKLSAEERWCSA